MVFQRGKLDTLVTGTTCVFTPEAGLIMDLTCRCCSETQNQSVGFQIARLERNFLGIWPPLGWHLLVIQSMDWRSLDGRDTIRMVSL